MNEINANAKNEEFKRERNEWIEKCVSEDFLLKLRSKMSSQKKSPDSSYSLEVCKRVPLIVKPRRGQVKLTVKV